MAKKILVVDDDTHLLDLLSTRLKEKGYEVVSAPDGYQAIHRANEEKPDLIILDIKLPARGGLSVSETLRKSELTKDIPIIMISAYDDANLIEDIKRRNMSFIPKPFDFVDLLEKVGKILGE